MTSHQDPPKETFYQFQERKAKEDKKRAAAASQTVKDMALAWGCVDADRCNGHVQPSGSCDACIIHADEVHDELARKGYRISLDLE